MIGRTAKGRSEVNAVRQTALDEIARTWSVDASDVTPTENGFDWLPGSHLVRVRVHEDEREPDGPIRFRITIATDFLRDAPVHDKQFVRDAGMVAQLLCATYSQVYPPAELVAKRFEGHPADVQLFSSAYVYDDTVKWTSGFLARMSILQPIHTERYSRQESVPNSGRPALATGRLKSAVNPVLDAAALDLIVPEGKKPSQWVGSEEFDAFIHEHGRTDGCFGFSNYDGMSLETPFASDSALIRFNADRIDPYLGSGLSVETQIRTTFDFDGVCEQAAWLNFYESVQWTDFPQLGSWHPLRISENKVHLAHTTFIPNAYFREGLVLSLAAWALTRVRWTRQKLLPNKQDLKMIEILEKRFGRSFR